MSFTDITLACRDCGSEFVFTAGEQEFYAQKGFDNQPTRCQNCRRARKSQRNDSGGSSYSNGGGGGYSSGGYSSGGYSSGGSSYSNGGGGGYSSGGGQRERVQYETTCSQCGKTTTVPFVPRGNKPVYCNDCFSQQRGGGSGGSGGSRGGGYNRY